MRVPYELKMEAVELYAEAGSAPYVIERLGLVVSPRTVQRWAGQVYGRRPSKSQLLRRNVLRDAVVRYLETEGLDSRYCSACQRRTFWPCLISCVSRTPDLDAFVFTCSKCAKPGAF